MQNKQGISLIVLSITILVMAILAATVIIALEDSGIIKRSKDTVKNTNYSEEMTRLIVVKNGILTDNLGTITIDEYIAELKNKGLIEDTITTNADGSKTVTTKSGFEVTISQEGDSELNIEFGENNGNDGDNDVESTIKISFTINNVAYVAEEGMTWAEWCASSYNIDKFYVDDSTNQIRYYKEDPNVVWYVYHDDGTLVKASEIISDNGDYEDPSL